MIKNHQVTTASITSAVDWFVVYWNENDDGETGSYEAYRIAFWAMFPTEERGRHYLMIAGVTGGDLLDFVDDEVPGFIGYAHLSELHLYGIKKEAIRDRDLFGFPYHPGHPEKLDETRQFLERVFSEK